MITGDADEGIAILSRLVGYDPATRSFTASASAPKEIDAYYLLAVVNRTQIRDADAADRILANG